MNNDFPITTVEQALDIFERPFFDLVNQAHQVHRTYFPDYAIQRSALLSIKTGGCPEDCKYCPQSAHYKTSLQREPLMQVKDVVQAAISAKEKGSTRFCLGAAWRGPTDKHMPIVMEMISQIKFLGMETCVTLGMLTATQAQQLKEAGLDYYNHNIDTSAEYYDQIITTRKFEDRVETLEHVRNAGLAVCCGGILGMGESNYDRIKMIFWLSQQIPSIESVPINELIPIAGTPLGSSPPADRFDVIRTIALTRILMPRTRVRLSAGRENMSDEMQALCFFVGANSIFYGEKLLTRGNPAPDKDLHLLRRLNLPLVMLKEHAEV